MENASIRCQQRIPLRASPWRSFYVPATRIHWSILTPSYLSFAQIYLQLEASQAWFTELKTFILSLGFQASHSNSSLFIHSRNPILVYFLVYVNDLLIIENSLSFIHHVITVLSNRFSVEGLGFFHFFLSMEVIPSPNGFFFSQWKYVHKLLARFHMEGIITPLNCTTWLI